MDDSNFLDDDTLEFLGELQELGRRTRHQQMLAANKPIPSGRYVNRNKRVQSCLRMEVEPIDPAVIAAEPLPENTPPLPEDQQFRLIYSDPCWRGEFGEPYDTLSDEQLAQLDIKSLIHPEGTVHFMWVVGSKVADAIALLRLWGFEFRDFTFVWAKTRGVNTEGVPKAFMGFGAGVRHNTEVCIEAHSKPNPMPVENNDVMQLVIAPVDPKNHSAKPEEVRERILRLYSAEPRIELFARNKFAGWVPWGLEVDAGIPQPSDAQPADIINVVPPTPSNSWWAKRKWKTTKEAADYLGVSPHRVIDFINDKRLDGHKQGNQWVVGKRSVENFAKKPRKTGRPKKED